MSNCARRLILNKAISKAGSANNLRKSNQKVSWVQLQRAKMDLDDIIIHYKTVKSASQKAPTETVKKVTDFYNRDTISRQLPYKNLIRKIKDYMGVYHRVPVRVMEVTLEKAYDTFLSDHPDMKIGRRTFKSLHPKNIRLRRYAQRLQCCCTYHTNIEYVRKFINMLCQRNDKESPFPNNETLISSALCEQNSLKCIVRFCQSCENFPKIDELGLTSLKCSKSCIKDNKDCLTHHQSQSV